MKKINEADRVKLNFDSKKKEAERAGFEPAVAVESDTSLAMMRIRPLCHLSFRNQTQNVANRFRRANDRKSHEVLQDSELLPMTETVQMSDSRLSHVVE